MASTVVYTPAEHTCDLPFGTGVPGTVRRCDCGRYWVLAKTLGRGTPPEAPPYQWRPERRGERCRRERAARRARRDYFPPSVPDLEAPPAATKSMTRVEVPDGWEPPSAAIKVTRGGYPSGDRTAADLPPPPASVTRPKTGGYSGLRPASEVPPPSKVPTGSRVPEATPFRPAPQVTADILHVAAGPARDTAIRIAREYDRACSPVYDREDVAWDDRPVVYRVRLTNVFHDLLNRGVITPGSGEPA